MSKKRRQILSHQLLGCAVLLAAAWATAPALAIAPDGQLVQFNDNGFWSWFQDERAIIDPATNQLLVSSIASGGTRDGNDDITSYNLNTGAITRFTLFDFSGADDHDSAALIIRPDGKYLAVYQGHQTDSLIRWRVSANPGDITNWTTEQSLSVTSNQGTTYANTFYLSSTGKTYDFFRGNNYDPHMLTSTDNGATWSYTGHLLMDPANSSSLRPYVKYTSNGVDRVYFISTQSHPRESDTGIYAGYITPADGSIHQINGASVGTLGTNTGTAVSVTDLTAVFPADTVVNGTTRTNAWTTDLALDSSGNPYMAFTSRVAGSTSDHRFYYARWTGSSFNVHEIAKAGGFLYSSEDDYTGLAALSTSDPNTLYISTKIDPRDGATTTSHYEIYRGFTTDVGGTWTWIPITTGSPSDNLRPIVPKWDSTHTALLWFQGTYTSYTQANAAVVGKFYTGNNGAWTNPAGGVWATTGNWMEQRIADGMSFIADFSTLDLPAGTATVSLGGASRTLGFLKFGDTNTATGGNWAITSGSLTLDGGVIAPSINVQNQTATIDVPIAGTSGLGKVGTGTLVLSGANTYTGGTTVSSGTLIMAHASALGSSGTVNLSTGTTLDVRTDGGDTAYNLNIGSGNTVTLASDVKTGSGGINHTLGTLIIGRTTIVNITSGANVASGSPSMTLGNITLGSGVGAGSTTFNPTTANLLVGAVSSTTNSAKTLVLDGTIAGNAVTGAITNGTNVVSVIKSNSSTWTLFGDNKYTGGTTVNGGTLIASHVGALGNGALAINGSATTRLAAGLSAPIQLPSLTIAGGSSLAASLDAAFNGALDNAADHDSWTAALAQEDTSLSAVASGPDTLAVPEPSSLVAAVFAILILLTRGLLRQAARRSIRPVRTAC